jgi:Na+/melibiose symporter-like transporter
MRKPWYLFGTILVPLSFFFVWEECWPCAGNKASEIVWYAIFASLFNVGWAAIQIAHMSMIPTLSPVQKRRDTLTGIRNAGTFVSNVIVLLIALVLFAIISSPQLQFTVLSLIVIAVGVSLNLLFIFVINEPELAREADSGTKLFHSDRSLKTDRQDEQEMQAEYKPEAKLTWRDWTRRPNLYIIGAVYMSARLASNVSSSLIPFYLTTVLAMGGVSSISDAKDKTPWELALIPLIMYCASTGCSITLGRLGKQITRLKGILLGAVFTCAGAAPLFVRTT